MSEFALGIATRCWDGWLECVSSWIKTSDIHKRRYVIGNTDVLTAYEEILRTSKEPIIGFMHDDLMIYEQGWDSRVLKEFSDPGVGLVGFGGGVGHGRPNLYEVPYNLPNLARQDYLSNTRDAEVHGIRFKGERDVAVLDGFALIVRREILEKAGGWNKRATYFMYSEWLCCETRRQGYRIRIVGVDCQHLGGKSSGYIPAADNYEEAHRYFYENNRDMMPYRVPE